MKHTMHEVITLASRAHVDQKTVRKYLRGEAVRPASAQRIRAAGGPPAPPTETDLRYALCALRDARHADLGRNGKVLLAVLFAREPNDNPSVESLASDAGLGRTVAHETLGVLKRLGLITVRRVPNGTNVYTVDLESLARLKPSARQQFFP